MTEHEALQAAVDERCHSNSSHNTEKLRSWLMSPQHTQQVVNAAWLLVALVFRRDDDVCAAAAVQGYVFKHLQQLYVSDLMTCSSTTQQRSNDWLLWCQVVAHAACRLLRSAFPAALELHDPQLQQLLQKQLRLFITGLLPSDVAAAAAAAAQQQQTAEEEAPQAAAAA